MTARPRLASAVPEDIVRAVYTVGFQHGALTLHDRLRGLAVCRGWREALFQLPIPSVEIRDGEEAYNICRWATLAQPRIQELHQLSALDLVAQAVHSVQRKELTKLVWGSAAVGIARVLPFPAVFSNLQSLEVGELVAASWWAGLEALKKLVHLQLSLQFDERQPGAAVQLPLLGSVTHLKLGVEPQTLVHLQLAQLPALAELHMHGRDGRAALLASGPAAQLEGLTCLLGQLSVDFSALPALKIAHLAATVQLDQGASIASIAAATALTRVELSDWQEGGEHGSALEVLQNLPRALRFLHLKGVWPAAAAALVGSLRGLAALDLEYTGEGQAPLPLEGMPVWTSLRAFSWVPEDEASLPQVIRQASKLQALQAWLINPSARDLELITSLPALRKISLPIGAVEDEGDINGDREFRRAQRAAARCVISRAMPQIIGVDGEAGLPLGIEEFSRWALE